MGDNSKMEFGSITAGRISMDAIEISTDTIKSATGMDSAVNVVGRRSASWQQRMHDIDAWLQSKGFDAIVDEVALMFSEEMAFRRWVATAVREDGVSMFNAAMDYVETFPLETKYSVEYNFLQKRGADWRVEAMLIRDGISPLHSAMESRFGGAYAQEVHFSFKVGSADEYREALGVLADNGCSLMQSCKSTYGVFSYWKVPTLSGVLGTVYLKPRVNLRDSNYEGGEQTLFDTPSVDSEEFGMTGLGSRYGSMARRNEEDK